MGGLVVCFLDRDGVIDEVVDHGEYYGGDGRIRRFGAPWKFSEFRLLPRVKEALVLLGQLGLLRILVTNQPDMAYGRLSFADHGKIMVDVAALPLDDVYVCPHPGSWGCRCHKPRPGMLLAAARKWRGDLSRSFIIGDTQSDLDAGRAAGCKVVLVRTPYNEGLEADFYADGLYGAAVLIQQLLKERRYNDSFHRYGRSGRD